jgi:hypothetical protein
VGNGELSVIPTDPPNRRKIDPRASPLLHCGDRSTADLIQPE